MYPDLRLIVEEDTAQEFGVEYPELIVVGKGKPYFELIYLTQQKTHCYLKKRRTWS
jgi:hypothetical protein